MTINIILCEIVKTYPVEVVMDLDTLTIEERHVLIFETLLSRAFLYTEDGKRFVYRDTGLERQLNVKFIPFMAKYCEYLLNLRFNPREFFFTRDSSRSYVSFEKGECIPKYTHELFAYLGSLGIGLQVMQEELDEWVNVTIGRDEAIVLSGWGLMWRGLTPEIKPVETHVDTIASTMDTRVRTVVAEVAMVRCMVRTVDGFRLRYIRGADRGAMCEITETMRGVLYGYQAELRVKGIDPGNKMIGLSGATFGKVTRAERWAGCERSVIPRLGKEYERWLSEWLGCEVGERLAANMEKLGMTVKGLSLYEDEINWMVSHGKRWGGGILVEAKTWEKFRQLRIVR